jgi:hypothetical protein
MKAKSATRKIKKWKIVFIIASDDSEEDEIELFKLNGSQYLIPNIGDTIWFEDDGWEVVDRFINYKDQNIEIIVE